MSAAPYFDAATFAFLKKLRANNNHDWFRAHKADYEAHVREPALRLIGDLQAPLAQVSSHMVARPAKQGGSLFRVMRDTRREHPEGPYKPWIGLRFYHEQKNNVHAPSYFVHIGLDDEDCFMGGGLWRPEPPTLKQLRAFIEANPRAWSKAIVSKSLAGYAESADRMTRVPQGFAADHPLAEELKRRSFVWTCPLTPDQARSSHLAQTIGHTFQDVAPVVDYLCAALDLPF